MLIFYLVLSKCSVMQTTINQVHCVLVLQQQGTYTPEWWFNRTVFDRVKLTFALGQFLENSVYKTVCIQLVLFVFAHCQHSVNLL